MDLVINKLIDRIEDLPKQNKKISPSDKKRFLKAKKTFNEKDLDIPDAEILKNKSKNSKKNLFCFFIN